MTFQFLVGFASKSFAAPIFGSKFARLGLLKPAPESISKCFPEALGAVFLLFAALETSLKIDGFSGGGSGSTFRGGGAKSCGTLAL